MWQKQDEDVRSDDEVQRAVMSQFLGIVPERGKELEQLWSDNNLLFSLLADGNEIRMEGGLYRHVRFNHRTLRVLWVASFAAWEAYRALVIAIESGRTPAFTRLNELLDCAVSIRDSATPINVPLPQGIPEPGSFVDGATFPELRAASELAVFVSGWAMLHEVRHVLHQREGTSTSEDDEPSKRREEELSCDAFATKFIMDKIDQYASTTGQNFASVALKRKIGIFFAMLTLAVLSKDRWEETDNHPSMQARMNAAYEAMYPTDDVDEAFAIAACAFGSLKMLWSGTPTFQRLTRPIS